MYNHLKNKSVVNLDAAMKLKEIPNHHHCSSIHCSYYSCFQVVKYILLAVYDVKENTIYGQRSTGTQKQQGEHEFIIDYLYRKIIESKDLNAAKDFKNNINLLKSLRTNSDYKDIAMDKQQSDQAYCLAEDIHKTLKKHFRYDS
jgi:hypothetical protein